MFRRTSKDQSATSARTAHDKGPGAKGRATPTRREAEAARRQRAKAGMDKKGTRKLQRQRRAAQNAKTRAGLRSGDERYLPTRDQGPVKRFIRDFVDARVSIAEFVLPLLIIIMVMQYSGSDRLLVLSTALFNTTLLVVALDTIWMVWRLKRGLRERFPDESTKGTTFYAMLRVLQLRWLRMPRARVKVGGAPR